MASFAMTLRDFHSHASIACLLYNAIFVQLCSNISTDNASHGPAIAEFTVVKVIIKYSFFLYDALEIFMLQKAFTE